MYKQPINKHRVLAMKDKFENRVCNNSVQSNSISFSEIRNNNIPQKVFLNNNNATTECTNTNIVPYLPKQINGSPKRIIKRSEAFRRDKNSSDSNSSFQRNFALRTSYRTKNIDDKIKLFDNSNTNKPLQRSGSFSDLYSNPRRKGNFSKENEPKSLSADSKHNLKIDNCNNRLQNTVIESSEEESHSFDDVDKLSTKKKILKSHVESHLEHKSLQETFKEALNKPLPAGPAPSKPPRTFLYTPNGKLSGERKIKTDNHMPNEKPPILPKESITKKGTSKFVKSDPKYMLDKLETALKNNRMKFKRQDRIGANFTYEDFEKESPKLDKKPSELKESNCNVNLAFEVRSEEICSTALNSVSTFKQEGVLKEKKWEPIYAEPFHHNKIKNERSSTNRNSLYYMSSPVVLVNNEAGMNFKN